MIRSTGANPRRLKVDATTLMPDRRTVLVTYTRGACERVNGASATLDGKHYQVDGAIVRGCLLLAAQVDG